MPEDDYDLEAAAKRLTESGFGQFEQAGEVFTGGARRLELRQNKNYGDDPDYQHYVKTVPILLPFIPLYSVAKYKWLVG